MTPTVSRVRLSDSVFYTSGTILLYISVIVPTIPFFLKIFALVCFLSPMVIHIAVRLAGFEGKLGRIWHKYAIGITAILFILHSMNIL
ncbi:MAG: hypothetical protein HGB18_04780 [Candidatus Moranbacteria bacterium]|nr:hypothetical protein [Candidatus Moranbacteria bacterium]